MVNTNKTKEKIMEGTEKQIKLAKEIIERAIKVLDESIAYRKTQIKTEIPSRWNTPEKIKNGLAKREIMNSRKLISIEKLERRKNILLSITDSSKIIDARSYLVDSTLINPNSKTPLF
jgi:hypothetical protein